MLSLITCAVLGLPHADSHAGLVFGIALCSLLVQRVVQRHCHMLWFREEAKKHVVADLDKDPNFDLTAALVDRQ